ncbi:RNA polymerase sigma factor [Olivibacter sp. XZL3]|uniref:RNA polymerase sigma factor n=1 Tax=Olivibacter sp. XZL3 TaxID=1735116 RepID=UPI0010659271|nr:sigma-70 family RNA polymerase sigma factor [Olivibacter sp. XZL3]
MREQFEWDDRSMWNGLVSGQKHAFTALVTCYTDTLYTYGIRLCQDEELVKDCIQEVFLFMWRRRTFLQQPASIKFYLMKAVRNKIFRELPKWQMNDELSTAACHVPDFTVTLEDPDEPAYTVQLQMKMYIDQLSPRQREILYLRFYEGIKQQKIAEIMNLTSQSVYNLLRSALLALKKKVDYEALITHLCMLLCFNIPFF